MAEPKDDVELVREMVRKAFWDILYHERGLLKSHNGAAHAQAVLIRGNYNFSLDDALKAYNEQEDADDATSADDWIRQIVGNTVNSIGYHERGMAEGHARLAAVKILIARGKYTEVDLDKLKSETESRLKE